MSGLDKYYQILGLNPGASEEEIKEAHRDLVNVWHPDRFSNNQRLMDKANEKLKEINIAYKKVKSHIAGGTSTTSEGQSYDESQPPPQEPSPQSEKEQDTTTDDKGQGDFQPPPEQPSGRPQPHAMEPIYAGFWHRFTAAFIDSFIVAAGSTMLSLPFLIAKGLSRTPSSPFWVVFDSILFMLIGWLYCTLLESSTKRATIGKMAVGILVTDSDGNRISFGRANGRCWGKSISFLILGIGYIMAGFTRRKQALHDLMADTLVLARPEGIRTWLSTTIIGGMAVLLVVGVAVIALNRQPTRTTDYPQTASAPPPSLIGGQLTSTQPASETELNASDWFMKGNSFRQSGLHRDAVNAYSKAIELEPTFVHAYALRGNMYYTLKNYQLAIKDYDKAIELNPKYELTYILRGLAYLDVQDYHQVIRDFDKARELDPSLKGTDMRQFYYIRGEAYYRLGLNDQALENVNRVIELDPNWPEIYPLRASILGNSQRTK